MQYRRLGTCGMRVSVLAYGTLTVSDAATDTSLLGRCFDAGINLFDTADAYGEKGEVEVMTGRLIRELPRDEIVLATKVRFGYGSRGENRRGLSRKHITHAIDGSLKRLGVDFIDLYQLHQWDPDCPIEETVQMMGDLLTRGKIVYWGLSNLNPTQTAETFRACDNLSVPYPVSHQPGYSVFEPGIVETQGKKFTGLDQLSGKYGFGMIVYSPLDAGVLTGKYRKGIPKDSRAGRQADNPQWKTRLRPEKLTAVEKLAPVAEKAGITLAQLALAWVLGRPGISAAIMGATNVRQLDENLKAADVTLDPQTLDAVEKIRTEYFTVTHQLVQ